MGGYKNSITDIDGKVGIGVSSPASFLSSARNLVVGSGSGNNGMTIYSQSNAIGDIAFADGTTGSSTYSGVVRYDHSVNAMSIFTSSSEKMRITSDGKVLFNTTAEPNGSSVYGSAFSPSTSDRSILRMATSNANASTLAIFYNPNGQVGSILTNGSATSYSTSSDYRLKENVVEMTGALDRVDALKPSRFNFIADPNKTVDGFLAHEVAEVVPEAISGEKDAVEEYEATPAVLDEDGNVIEEAVMGTRPVYQGIDQSKLVPLLVGAIQELRAEIEALKQNSVS